MIKIPITYTNFDDEVVTEEHYFHLSKSELIDMVQSGDGALIMKTFREIISSAYGQRVDGSGSQFYKDPDLTKRFLGSLAFDQLLVDLLTNTVSAAAFVNGLLPSGLDKLVEIAEKTAVKDVPLPFEGQAPVENHPDLSLSGLTNPMDETGRNPLPWAFREPTPKEVSDMAHHQLQDVTRRKMSSWKPPVPA